MKHTSEVSAVFAEYRNNRPSRITFTAASMPDSGIFIGRVKSLGARVIEGKHAVRWIGQDFVLV